MMPGETDAKPTEGQKRRLNRIGKEKEVNQPGREED